MRRFGLVSILTTSCTASLPPVPVDTTPVVVDAERPIRGRGQLVVDAVDAPTTTHLDEVLGTVRLRTGAFFRAHSHVGTVMNSKCDALPCVVDVAPGQSTFDVSDDREHERFRLDVLPDTRTHVRVRLPEHHTSPWATLGWTLASLGIAPTIAGTTMIAADPGSLGPAGTATLIGGVALGVIGVILGITHPATERPGTVISF